MALRPLKTTEFVLLCSSLISLTAISIDGLLPAFRQISLDFHLNDVADTQYLISLFFLGMVIGELAVGAISDAIGRKRTLAVGLTIYGVGTVIAMFATDMETILVGRFIQGVGVSGSKVITRAMVRDLYEGEAMARIMSFVMMVFILVPMIAPFLGQILSDTLGWQAVFVAYLVLAVALMIWVGLRQPETLSPENRLPLSGPVLWRNALTIFSHRRVVTCACSSGLIFSGSLLYLSIAPTLFHDLYAIDEDFPIYFAILAVPIGLVSFLNGKLVMRYGMYRLAMIALCLLIAANAVFWIIAFIFDGVPPFWIFMALFSVTFGCLGMLLGNINAMGMQSLGRVAGLGSSLMFSLSSLVAVSASVFWGQFYNQTVGPVILAYLFAGIVAMILVRIAHKSPIAPV
jgi:MFS transporter, DHA1 family, multidrug resistance protein